MLKKGLYLLLIVAVVQLMSCSKFQKALKSDNPDLKYEKAIEYYNKKDYFRAQQLFDDLVPYFRGTEKAEIVNYYYAYCYYGQEDYILASYHFKNFVRIFPKSKHAEECMFLSAYCKFLDSPVYTLDQTSTREAIKQMQLYINYYPQSERLDQCNELIDQLRYKLQKKDYEIGFLYYKTSNYQASVTTFNNVLKDYPDTKFKEDILYYIVKANYYYAFHSIESKLLDRYTETTISYKVFVKAFPESKYSKELNHLYENSEKQLKAIEDNKKI